MAISYLTSINLHNNELMNAALHNLAAAPDSPVEGQMYFNTVSKALYVWNGTGWTSASGEYTHPSDGGGSISTALTGPNVISSITVNSAGHVTATTTRALTASDIGASATGHTHGTYDRATSVLTGANVFSDIVVEDGIVTGTATRALTAADVGAATSGHTHTYAQVLTSLTGATSAASNGQLLIGDGTDFTKATLTQGANVTITNAAGSITIASTDTNTTYSVSAETVTGGANLRLSGSDTSTDDVAIKGSGATTVTRTDVNTITISSTDTNTTYTAASPLSLTGTEFGHLDTDGNKHVPATGTTNDGKFLKAGATAGSLSWTNVTKTDVGLANVTNDAQVKKSTSSTSGNIVTWNGTTGDALNGTTGSYSVETTLTGGATAIPRADAVKTYVDGLLGANDAMVFKGTLGTGGTITALPTTYSAGWAYKVITTATYAGIVCEIGDLIIATVDRAGSDNLNSDWTVVQTNVDGAVTGPASAASGNLPTFNGTTGKVIQDSGVALTSLAPLASPAFTGNPTATTQAADNNSTRLATTAFVVGQASSTTPSAASGAGAIGTSLKYARADHVHPATSLKYSATITGGTTSEVITHNLNTKDVIVQLYRVASPYDTVFTDVERTSVNTITLRFAVAPSAGEYRVVIVA